MEPTDEAHHASEDVVGVNAKRKVGTYLRPVVEVVFNQTLVAILLHFFQ